MDWDATDGRHGGSQHTVWKFLLETGNFGPGLGEGLRAGQSSCGVRLGDALQFRKDLASAVRVLRAPEASAVRRMCGGAASDHHGHPARVQVELFAFGYCIAGCIK